MSEQEQLPQLQMLFAQGRQIDPAWMLPPAGYSLRTYRPGDEAGFYRLMAGAGWPGWDDQRLAPWKARMLPKCWFLVVHNASQEIVASAMGIQDHSDLHPFGGELGWVACDPAHQGQKLGTVVCSAVTARLLEIGYDDIHLYTEDWRLAALKTYLRLGYQPMLLDQSYYQRWQQICQKLNWPFTPEAWPQVSAR
jgi:Acetyltransferases